MLKNLKFYCTLHRSPLDLHHIKEESFENFENSDCYRFNTKGLQPQRPQTIQGLKLFRSKALTFITSATLKFRRDQCFKVFTN